MAGGILGDFFKNGKASSRPNVLGLDRHPLEAANEDEFFWVMCRTWRDNIGYFVPGGDFWLDGHEAYLAGHLNPPTIH